jgi:antitoxin (DNA-binding transcriptional repressor) of toxin-antitoxin stability system
MKRVKDYIGKMLRDEVEVIDATELRRHIGECLTLASAGKSFCVKRKGKIVAFLVPPEEACVVHEIHSDGSSPTLDLGREAEQSDG